MTMPWTVSRVMTLAVILAGVAGCTGTTSFEAKYTPIMTPLEQADQLRSVRLGIAKFQDTRRIVKADEPKTLAYIAKEGFGLTYKGREMTPVADLVQALFVEEFVRGGIQSSALPEVLTKDALSAMRAAGEKAAVDHVLGGRIAVFEFDNKDVAFYWHTRRSVALEIHLLRVSDGGLVVDSVAAGGGEGDGPRPPHPTSVDRLLNRVFRLVVLKVVEEVAQKLVVNPRDVHVRVAILNP